MTDATIWKEDELVHNYLSGIRGAIPLANTQIDIMRRVINKFRPAVSSFLDLGCGDGILGHQLLQWHPSSRGIFLDFSPEMLSAAGNTLKTYSTQLELVNYDYGAADWVNLPAIQQRKPFDVVVSGFSIHHQPDSRKREIYAEIHELLAPGGIFLNLEHVSSPSYEIETLFEDQFIDHLTEYHSQIGSGKDRQQVADELYNRPDKDANILLDVETQCDWLREIGFVQVDCFFKCFELALFGGQKA